MTTGAAAAGFDTAGEGTAAGMLGEITAGEELEMLTLGAPGAVVSRDETVALPAPVSVVVTVEVAAGEAGEDVGAEEVAVDVDVVTVPDPPVVSVVVVMTGVVEAVAIVEVETMTGTVSVAGAAGARVPMAFFARSSWSSVFVTQTSSRQSFVVSMESALRSFTTISFAVSLSVTTEAIDIIPCWIVMPNDCSIEENQEIARLVGVEVELIPNFATLSERAASCAVVDAISAVLDANPAAVVVARASIF